MTKNIQKVLQIYELENKYAPITLLSPLLKAFMTGEAYNPAGTDPLPTGPDTTNNNVTVVTDDGPDNVFINNTTGVEIDTQGGQDSVQVSNSVDVHANTGPGEDVGYYYSVRNAVLCLGAQNDVGLVSKSDFFKVLGGPHNDVIGATDVKDFTIEADGGPGTGPNGQDEVTVIHGENGFITTEGKADVVGLGDTTNVTVITGSDHDISGQDTDTVISQDSEALSITTGLADDNVVVDRSIDTYINTGPDIIPPLPVDSHGDPVGDNSDQDAVLMTNGESFAIKTGGDNDVVVGDSLAKFDINTGPDVVDTPHPQPTDNDQVTLTNFEKGDITTGVGNDVTYLEDGQKFNYDGGPGDDVLGAHNIAFASLHTGSGVDYTEVNNAKSTGLFGGSDNGMVVLNNYNNTSIDYTAGRSDLAINDSTQFAFYGSSTGDNVIINKTSLASVYGYDGNDLIQVKGTTVGVYIDGGLGNDTVTVDLDSTSGNIDVWGKDGTDTLNFKGSISSVKYLKGTDWNYYADITTAAGKTLRVSIDYATENVQFNGVATSPVFT